MTSRSVSIVSQHLGLLESISPITPRVEGDNTVLKVRSDMIMLHLHGGACLGLSVGSEGESGAQGKERGIGKQKSVYR